MLNMLIYNIFVLFGFPTNEWYSTGYELCSVSRRDLFLYAYEEDLYLKNKDS